MGRGAPLALRPYDGQGSPKLLEFNADTPTALVEAAVVQWYWKEDCFKECDQFNSIHEKLIAKWQDIAMSLDKRTVYFCHMDDFEDWMTVSYLRDTASQAGISSYALLMDELGWNDADGTFRDLTENKISTLFKLYPWEWLIGEIPPGADEAFHSVKWIEPVWRMLWSNKAMLAIMWELNRGHPALLETHIGEPGALRSYVRKPIFSREGANVEVFNNEPLIQTGGPYGAEGYVYQEIAPLYESEGNFAVLGSWYITDQGAAGMGIRESTKMVTDNLSRFVPHIIA
jgi:glutathionylspermidine synthase